ncbi:MAG: ATP-binding protein [Candidatus Methanoperedens sp.]
MDERKDDTHSEAGLDSLAIVSAVITISISGLALAGWLLNWLIITRISPDYIPMAPSTAIFFFISGAALLVYSYQPDNLTARKFSKVGVAVILVICFIILAEFLTGSGFEIERILLPNPEKFDQVPVGRMSPITAACFVLSSLALSLLLFSQKGKQRTKSIAAYLTTSVLSVGLVILLGYLYGTPLLYGGTIIPVALTTAIAFVFLSFGLITAVGPDYLPLRLFIGHSVRARLMRAFLPVTFAFIVIDGWLHIVVFSHTTNLVLESSILVILSLFIIGSIITKIAEIVGGDIDRANVRRKLAEENTQKQIMRIRTLQSIDSKVLSDAPIHDIIKYVITNVPKELGGDVMAICLLNNGMSLVRLPTGEIIEEDILSISEDMMEWFEKEKEAIAVYDLEFESRVQIHYEGIRDMKIVSYLGVPMVAHDKIIGIMHLLTHSSKDFAKDDIVFFSTLAGQAAIAIDRSKATEALRESEQKYRTIIETANEGVWTIDASGKTSYVNSNMAQMLGCTEEEMLGRDLFDFMDADARIDAESYLERRKQGIIETYDFRFSKKDGTNLWAIVSSAPIFDKQGQYNGALKMITNITERKKAEALRLENLRLEAADKAKSEFLASMSHELRTPLNAVLGFSQLLNDGLAGELNEKQKHFVDNINNSGNFLLSLINDILDLSKIEAGKIELVPDKMSVPETIKETLSLIKEKAMKHKVLLKTEIDPELEFIEADKQRFKQVLFNLLSNAVKFSKEEGGAVTITAKKEGDMAQISVSDTGIGIKEENIGRLFHKFEQLESGISQKYGGTGLGLAITKQLVELHGGRIWAESKFGEGSKFTFSIPLETKKGGKNK